LKHKFDSLQDEQLDIVPSYPGQMNERRK